MSHPDPATPNPRSFTDSSIMPSSSLPLRVDPAPDPIDRELEPLLGEPFVSAWAGADGSLRAASGAVRGRLLERLSASRAASNAMFTARQRRLAPVELAPGVRARTLYMAAADRPLRPGEPVCAQLIELAAGAHWPGPAAQHHREWLVLQGSVRLGEESLALRDYHVAPAGNPARPVRSEQGALLFLRESVAPAASGDAAFTVRDEAAGWPEYAPGIRRRVLWQHEGQAAMLYCAQAGTSVPLHTHGHDEECLMLQGELFLDDVLLQQGDYQLAPAGTGHRVTETDTGAVIYAHGDLDLKFVAG
jgi:quercetin dioxygenase-like cupin family protein